MIIKISIKKVIVLYLITLTCILFGAFSVFADSKTENEEDLYAERIEKLNDGYYIKLKFKKVYDNGRFYGAYEDLYENEVIILNDNHDKKPISISASMLGWSNLHFSINSFGFGNSIFYIIELDGSRYIRVYNKGDKDDYYDLYDEDGKKIKSMLKICDYLDSNKKNVIVQGSLFTYIYDTDFKKEAKEFKYQFNTILKFKLNPPLNELIYLGKKSKSGRYESGGIILDDKLNIIFDNLSFNPLVVLNKEIEVKSSNDAELYNKYVEQILSNDKNITYDYILLSKNISNVKHKNKISSGETFIIDLNMNTVFSLNQKLVSCTLYFTDSNQSTLLVFDDIYYILDKDMNIIEKGNPLDQEFKNKKEINDFNSSFHYEYKPS